MKKYIRISIAFVVILILTFCKENVNGPEFPITVTPITDDELYELAYSDYEWPSNFYYENLSGGALYYENTISITPLTRRSNVWKQLCTDYIAIAKLWSELSSNYSSYYRDLVSQRETEKYYEFKRVYSIHPSDIILSRVHKCSYLDRSMYDFLKPERVIGVFTKNNFNRNDAKELIEYLWFTENYDNASSRIHQSLIETNNFDYVYYLYEIGIVFGDFGMKDSISYIKHTFKISISNGEIIHDKELIKIIDGKQN